jgi:hypothetical protein
MQKKNAYCIRPENLKKDVRRPRRIQEENFKNNLGERVYKNVDSIMCLE